MKIHLALAASCALGLGAHANVLTNAGFETDDASGGDVQMATGWTDFGEAYTSEAQAHSGVNSLKLFGPEPYLGPPFDPPTSGATQSFAAAPTEEWTFSAWAFTSSLDALTDPDIAVVKIEFLDAGAAVLKAQEVQITASNLPADTWTQFSVDAIAPPGTASVQAVLVFVQLGFSVGGSVYFDDADLSTTGPVTYDPGELANGSFEVDDASTFDQMAATGWQVFDNSARFTTDTVSRLGSQSVKMFGPFVPEGGQAVYQDFPAAPSDIWSASAFAYNDTVNNSGLDAMQGDNFAIVQLQFLNGAGNALASFDSEVINASSPTDTWIGLSASGTAPAGTVTVRILLLHVQLNDPVTGGAIFFDDASLAKTGEDVQIVDRSKAGSTFSITFTSQATSLYSVKKSPNALDAFTVIQSGIPGTGADIIVTDTAATEDSAFYVIEAVEAPPVE